jgi:hypothetical protein
MASNTVKKMTVKIDGRLMTVKAVHISGFGRGRKAETTRYFVSSKAAAKVAGGAGSKKVSRKAIKKSRKGKK